MKRLLVVGLAGCAALSLATPAASEAAVRRAGKTTIVVSAGHPTGRVPVHQLGVNSKFPSNGRGLWDAAADRPNPVAVQRLRRSGVSDIRYPGGTVGNLFDWKQAIGNNRGCQTNGKWTPRGFRSAKASAYGLDEHMELVHAVGAKATMTVPFVTGSPSDAANWVEYMNSPADGLGGRNPNGGTDWAMVRAQNGHQAPYGVRWWEIGNEQRLTRQRYWMSANKSVAMHQYANGDTVRIRNEMLGRACRHRFAGAVSDGQPNQVFQLLYPPVKPGSVTVDVLGTPGVAWHEVATFDTANNTDPVYVVDEDNATVRFGDGNRGAVLPPGARVRASYTSVHRGVFAFAKAMRKVDPHIKACVTWGLKPFIRIAGKRKYNCFAAHAYTTSLFGNNARRANALQGHDANMIGTNRETSFVEKIKRALPRHASLVLTEFGSIIGERGARPRQTASMTRALYLASMWASWLDFRIPLAVGGNMIGAGKGGMLGPAPHFAMSAEALTREALRPLYAQGGGRLQTRVLGNPVRNPKLVAGNYHALKVAATRTRHDLRILVVNRLPSQRVRSKVDLRGFNSRRVASVSLVNGPSVRSLNNAKRTQVHLRTSHRRIGRDGFTAVFPAHSVTVIKVPGRR